MVDDADADTKKKKKNFSVPPSDSNLGQNAKLVLVVHHYSGIVREPTSQPCKVCVLYI